MLVVPRAGVVSAVVAPSARWGSPGLSGRKPVYRLSIGEKNRVTPRNTACILPDCCSLPLSRASGSGTLSSPQLAAAFLGHQLSGREFGAGKPAIRGLLRSAASAYAATDVTIQVRDDFRLLHRVRTLPRLSVPTYRPTAPARPLSSFWYACLSPV